VELLLRRLRDNLSRINNGIFKTGSLLVLVALAIATCLSMGLSAQELPGTKDGLQGVVTVHPFSV
jgi:hypothetical protein